MKDMEECKYLLLKPNSELEWTAHIDKVYNN